MRSGFFIAISFFCCLSASEEGLSLRRIADFWEEGEYQIAKNQIEIFLNEFPESSYANVLSAALGDLFLREKNYRSALDHYAKAEDQDSVFFHKLQCFYHLEEYVALADACEGYLKKPDLDESRRLQTTYFLAIALYHQSLNASKEAVVAIADRARPYFETLAASELSGEVAGAFAHLCCILKDFETASKLYTHLANSADNSQELLFRAALLQSKFDKELALQNFKELTGSSFAEEACYNQLVLHYELGHYQEIVDSREIWKEKIPADRKYLAHLFLGKSFFALKEYEKSAEELILFSETPSEGLRAGLLQLVEASYLSSELSLLDQAIDRLKKFDPADPELATALFSRALLLKKQEKKEEALAQFKEIFTEFPDASNRSIVCFELAQLEFVLELWEQAKEHSLTFLQIDPKNELVPYAWHYAAQSALELRQDENLEEILSQGSFLSGEKQAIWSYHLAKLQYELEKFSQAGARLHSILSTNESFPLKADAELLLAFCYAKHKDEKQFTNWAEAALEHQSSAIPVVDQHLALFNSYIAQELFEPAATHLYAAFQLKAPIQQPNLLWLANFLLSKNENESAYSVFLASELTNEEDFLKLAKLHLAFNAEEQAVAILEKLTSLEGKLAFAEHLLQLGQSDRSEQIFDEMVAANTLRNCFCASAALQSAKLKIMRGDFETAAVFLKDLTIQKTFDNEPIHLEAALEYADFQKDLTKKLLFLRKMKHAFETQEDLLSKDYHAARENNVEKNKLYEAYMSYFDAQILLVEGACNVEQQKELQAKAKTILLQITSKEKSPLELRVQDCLSRLD